MQEQVKGVLRVGLAAWFSRRDPMESLSDSMAFIQRHKETQEAISVTIRQKNIPETFEERKQ